MNCRVALTLGHIRFEKAFIGPAAVESFHGAGKGKERWEGLAEQRKAEPVALCL